jgi:4-oxalocrotonate tautomerase
MPYLHLRINEDRLTPDKETELIAALTDAVASVYGDEIRRGTWVTLEAVPPSRWGVAGRPLPPL